MDPIDVKKLEKFQPEYRESKDVEKRITITKTVSQAETARFLVYVGTRQMFPCFTVKEALKHAKWNMHAVVEIYEDDEKIITIRRS